MLSHDTHCPVTARIRVLGLCAKRSSGWPELVAATHHHSRWCSHRHNRHLFSFLLFFLLTRCQTKPLLRASSCLLFEISRQEHHLAAQQAPGTASSWGFLGPSSHSILSRLHDLRRVSSKTGPLTAILPPRPHLNRTTTFRHTRLLRLLRRVSFLQSRFRATLPFPDLLFPLAFDFPLPTDARCTLAKEETPLNI